MCDDEEVRHFTLTLEELAMTDEEWAAKGESILKRVWG